MIDNEDCVFEVCQSLFGIHQKQDYLVSETSFNNILPGYIGFKFGFSLSLIWLCGWKHVQRWLGLEPSRVPAIGLLIPHEILSSTRIALRASRSPIVDPRLKHPLCMILQMIATKIQTIGSTSAYQASSKILMILACIFSHYSQAIQICGPGLKHFDYTKKLRQPEECRTIELGRRILLFKIHRYKKNERSMRIPNAETNAEKDMR